MADDDGKRNRLQKIAQLERDLEQRKLQKKGALTASNHGIGVFSRMYRYN